MAILRQKKTLEMLLTLGSKPMVGICFGKATHFNAKQHIVPARKNPEVCKLPKARELHASNYLARKFVQ